MARRAEWRNADLARHVRPRPADERIPPVMNIALALSPLIVVAAGALLLMLVEAFSTRPVSEFTPDPDSGGMALGATAVLFTGAAFAAALWMVGVDRFEEASSV